MQTDLNSNEYEVLLPQTEEELDAFVENLTADFALPAGDDTYDAIATMIMHLPHTKSRAYRSYFADGVYKALANRAAYNKLQSLRVKREAAQQEKEKALSLVETGPELEGA